MLKKLESILLKAEKRVFALIMASMLAILTVHVFMRYLFNSPLIWTDEVVTIMQGVIAFLGIGYCFHRKQHTELALLYNKVPRPVQCLFDIVSNSVMLFCLAHLVRVGVVYVTKQNIPLGTISWVKLSYFYIWIPVGLVIAMCYVAVQLAGVFVSMAHTYKTRASEEV